MAILLNSLPKRQEVLPQHAFVSAGTSSAVNEDSSPSAVDGLCQADCQGTAPASSRRPSGHSGPELAQQHASAPATADSDIKPTVSESEGMVEALVGSQTAGMEVCINRGASEAIHTPGVSAADTLFSGVEPSDILAQAESDQQQAGKTDRHAHPWQSTPCWNPVQQAMENDSMPHLELERDQLNASEDGTISTSHGGEYLPGAVTLPVELVSSPTIGLADHGDSIHLQRGAACSHGTPHAGALAQSKKPEQVQATADGLIRESGNAPAGGPPADCSSPAASLPPAQDMPAGTAFSQDAAAGAASHSDIGHAAEGDGPLPERAEVESSTQHLQVRLDPC